MGTKFFECEYTDEGEVVFRMRRPRRPEMRARNLEARGHFLDARREFLMGVRSLLDTLLEKVPEPEEDRRRRRREISVE